jgi:hypothetical protein
MCEGPHEETVLDRAVTLACGIKKSVPRSWRILLANNYLRSQSIYVQLSAQTHPTSFPHTIIQARIVGVLPLDLPSLFHSETVRPRCAPCVLVLSLLFDASRLLLGLRRLPLILSMIFPSWAGFSLTSVRFF